MRGACLGGVAMASAALLAACATWIGRPEAPAALARFSNAYVVAENTGARVPPAYFLRRAWVQITRDLARTEVPPTVPSVADSLSEGRGCRFDICSDRRLVFALFVWPGWAALHGLRAARAGA